MKRLFFALLFAVLSVSVWAGGPVNTGGGSSGGSSSSYPSLSAGVVLSANSIIATNSFVLLSDITSGTVAPFTVTIQNTGSAKVCISKGLTGFTATDSAQYIAVGDSLSLYSATENPVVGMIATGATSSVGITVWK